MLLHVTLHSKSLGNKQLFNGLGFTVEPDEKLAIIGRNGVGKTTLFNLLTGQDTDYDGQIILKRGTRLVSTAQEHHNLGDQSAVEYIIANLPGYAELKEILDTYPDTMGDNMTKIETYTDALQKFSDLGYYHIREAVLLSLMDYQLTEPQANGPMQRLSGGQKRFVELVRIEHSNVDLALIDEPTNHMDYAAKQAFVDWFKAVRHTVVVISHDRDVLQCVDRIIEIKDGHAQVYKGNYQEYLKQNATSTTTKMHDYEVAKRTLDNLRKQIQAVRAKKASTSKTPNPFIPLERRLVKEFAELEAATVKPNFWIDRESAENLSKKAGDSYEKYKAKNIRIQAGGNDQERQRELLQISELQLGYTQQPLFMPIAFSLRHGERMQLVGRNGVGKTTLVRAIIAAVRLANQAKTGSTTAPKDAGKNVLMQHLDTWRAGTIRPDHHLRLSVYEQEIDSKLLTLTLAQAIEHIFDEAGQSPTQQSVMQAMGDYLFDPPRDGGLTVDQLSGGQKARLQIIKMLANQPNLLILDEPTNHLDLPSIEELETALSRYTGALLYVSHDSYFARNMGGETVTLQATT